MILDEENLEQEMNLLFKENNDWIKVFDVLEKRVNQISDKYSSIKSNFHAIFNYVLLKNKIDINSYENIIKYLYKYSSKENIANMLVRFFNYRDSDITIADYVKLDKYNNQHSKWNNMACLFFNLENEKIILDRVMLPYLIKMLDNIPKNKVKALYEGRFSSFCRMLVSNFEELIPLIQLSKSNKIFEIREPKEYGSFIETVLSHVGSFAYDLTTQELINIRTILEKEYPDFMALFLDNLLKNDDFSTKEKIKYEPGLYRFALEVQLDIIPGINQRYLGLLKEQQKEKESSNLYFDGYYDLVSDFKTSLDISLEKHQFHLDLNQIDITMGLKENWLLLKCLEIKMKKEEFIEISNELMVYITNLLSKKEENSNYYLENFKLEKELMLKYINYLKLDATIKINNNNKTKNKI